MSRSVPLLTRRDSISKGESAMNWEQIRGNWKQFRGAAKTRWGKLTDDDMTAMEGRRDQLVGRLQERYGYVKEAAEREIDDWLASEPTYQ